MSIGATVTSPKAGSDPVVLVGAGLAAQQLGDDRICMTEVTATPKTRGPGVSAHPLLIDRTNPEAISSTDELSKPIVPIAANTRGRSIR